VQPRDEPFDPTILVVVPTRPGALRRLDDANRGRDDVDDVLDDLFGEPDQRGPGIADAVLVAGGAGVAAVGQLASWPTPVTVVGIAAAALGLVLPARSAWRRAGATRRTRRLAAVVGNGMLLRTDDDLLSRLVAAHDRIEQQVETSRDAERARSVAHAAAYEVASLLEGRLPVTAAEREYVAARTAALDEVAALLADPGLPPEDHRTRQAIVDARQEVEQIAGGSSVTDAAELLRELRERRRD
jgi:hypothetical protein